MQIRLTVLGPLGGPHTPPPARADVLVTAPVGTPLAAVASALAGTVAGPDTGGAVVLWAGPERLDPQRRVLGEPPLVDGAVLAVHTPVPDVLPDGSHGPQLRVVAGPDAGGVHLLHPGPARIGRSADADVPLDDPDVSRLHCVVVVDEDGRVGVADLDSTNGTTLDGEPVHAHMVPLPPGAELRIGESTLRLAGAGPAAVPTRPDAEGRLALALPPRAPAPAPAVPAPAISAAPPVPPAGAVGAPPVPAVPRQPLPAPTTPAALPHTATGTEPEPEPGTPRRGRGLGAWARRLTGREDAAQAPLTPPAAPAPHAPGPYGTDSYGTDPYAEAAAHGTPAHGTDTGPDTGAPAGRPHPTGARPGTPRTAHPGPDTAEDPAALLLTALGPTDRLWAETPDTGLPAVLGAGCAVDLREIGALGLIGPRPRLAGVARAVVARLAARLAPGRLEIVLLAVDRARTTAERHADWSWLGWLPHTRPTHGQNCRLLLAHDRDQLTARIGELTRRLDDSPLGQHWASADPERVRALAAAHTGPLTLVVLDGDPGPGTVRDLAGRLATHGPAIGVHLLVLAEAPAASPASPVAHSHEAGRTANPVLRDVATVGLLSGDVATAVRLFTSIPPAVTPRPHGPAVPADAVSPAWAERFARALAPLRPEEPGERPDPAGAPGRTPDARTVAAAALPAGARLLDELGLARATPASLMARWAAGTDQGQSVGGLAEIVLGAGLRGTVGAELVAEGPHVLIEGPPGSGRTELLRSLAASLASAARPDRLGLLLVDGAGGERGEGLAPCTDLPHTAAHLPAADPVRMREFAQALGAELKRRHELLAGLDFADWHARRAVSDRMVSPRRPSHGESLGDLDSHRTGTLRLRDRGAAPRPESTGPHPLPRLVVLVDDYDALVAPALGSTGRPAAGSVVRALEAVAREGARLGVHLVVASARPERTAHTDPARLATLRVELLAPEEGGPGVGRGVLHRMVLDEDPEPGADPTGGEPEPDAAHPPGPRVRRELAEVPFQTGRVTGRIPRTATQRPTVVPLEWERMGDPPARRPLRELGNGPTDLALLASALDRASHLVSAVPVLFPPSPASSGG
ncbi:FHA domain-containing protein [Streptomyces sp. BI20]|uniref:FHA domain-containing protein n=1 Tax=Streptomyces sp. BI20 TaxID=3403460 RepID=UPI003C73D548